jgi:hypothetical protein
MKPPYKFFIVYTLNESIGMKKIVCHAKYSSGICKCQLFVINLTGTGNQWSQCLLSQSVM